MRNKKVIITGATGRLGRAIALEFARLGADVVPLKFDAAKTNGFERIIKRAAQQLKGIDILVNAAGTFFRTPLCSTMPADWDEFFNVNLRAPFFLSKYAAPFLKKAKPGRIINIADTYGASPSAGFVPYGTSKAGLIAMTKGLAKELAPEVLVNCVCPGVIARNVSDEAIPCTSFPPPIKSFGGKRQRESHVHTRDPRFRGDDILWTRDDKATNATLLKRPVSVKDVVDAVIFLARNDSMTGQAVYVDCGGPSLRA